MARSGLQRDVLVLYRSCLRALRKKPAEYRPNWRSFAREEFHKNAQVDRKDFATIEYLLRKGQRQLELYTESGIKNIMR